MTIASSTRKPATANKATPVPPAFTLIFSSDFASWISFWIRPEMSRLASVTRRPIVGSVSRTGSGAMRGYLRAGPRVGKARADPIPVE